MSHPCLKTLCVIILFGGMSSGCKDTDPVPENPDQDVVTLNADEIADHLLFPNATKINGPAPKGPTGSSLKISIEDTLSLVDKFQIPVNFLHEDTTQNIAGIYAHISSGPTGASFYYDIPEVPDIATNDTVSVVLIGIDKDGLIDDSADPSTNSRASEPFFDITLVPYDQEHKPLGEVKMPARISTTSTNISGDCGLVNRADEFWIWASSYIIDPSSGEYIFFNSRDKLWGLGGQLIQGCCNSGDSEYSLNCPDKNRQFLIFQTFFNWPNEIYHFFDDGTYGGISEFLSGNPDPIASDFCDVRPGIVHTELDSHVMEGTWKVNAASFLTTLASSEPPKRSLAARPDGRIVQVDCDFLIIEQRDLEGGNRTLIKTYVRWISGRLNWFSLE